MNDPLAPTAAESTAGAAPLTADVSPDQAATIPDTIPDTIRDTTPDTTADATPDIKADSQGGHDIDLTAIERDLTDVQTALERLNDGSYWTDEVTGNPIPDDVLATHPTARTASPTLG